jgi:hypothetical protein
MAKRDRRRQWRRATRLTVEALADEVCHASARHVEGPGWARRAAARLVATAAGPAPFAQAANAALTAGLEVRWQQGWQPVDVWQIVRRRMDDGFAEFVVDAMASESLRYAEAAVHPRWRAQLVELGARAWWRPDECFVAAVAARDGLDPTDVLTVVLEVLGQLRALPPQPLLIPPPGSPEAARAGVAAPGAAPDSAHAGEVDPKILARVRGLLAKAESTDFPEEADAFFAKAQELMSRYSLERAAVEALTGADGVSAAVHTDGRRIWLDNPYLSPKSMLVGVVAEANRCRAVFSPELGFVTVVGERTDTDIVEVLTTSLLVQADRAMLAAGRRVDQRGQSRTKSFRQSFLISYAQRIGERLTTAAAEAETAVSESVGGGLLPVLAARERAVQDRVDELFPRLASRRVSVSNSAGWLAGRAAADLAVLDVRRAVRA